MRADYIIDAMERIDDELIFSVEAKRIKQQNAERRRIWIAAAAAAACLCVTAGALILPRLADSPIAEPDITPVTSISETALPDNDDALAGVGGENSAEKQTFNDVAHSSYAFVFARCTDIVMGEDGRAEYRFDTITHLAGGEMPKKFAVTALGTELPQIEGEHYYVLPIYKSVSVFYDEYERYHLTAETLFETDADGNIASSEIQGIDADMGFSNVGELKAYLDSSEAVCSQGDDDIGTKYSAADDIEGVYRDSDYILEVEPIGINTDFFEDRTSYDCRVLSIYKSVDDTDEIIDVTTTKGAMEIGQRYVIAINRVSEGSDMFIISSHDRSVYPSDSREADKMTGLSENIRN